MAITIFICTVKFEVNPLFRPVMLKDCTPFAKFSDMTRKSGVRGKYIPIMIAERVRSNTVIVMQMYLCLRLIGTHPYMHFRAPRVCTEGNPGVFISSGCTFEVFGAALLYSLRDPTGG